MNLSASRRALHNFFTRRPSLKLPARFRPTVEFLEERVVPTWIGALNGATNDAAHNYNNPANWAGGVIDDSFLGVTFTGTTTLYFNANRTTGAAGLNLNYNGNVDLSLESTSAAPLTLALAGPVAGDFGGAANNQIVSIGLPSNPLNIDMGGGATFNVAGAGDTLKVYNVIANGSLTKTGPGTLNLLGNNTYVGATNILAGTLKLGGVSVVPAGAAGYYSYDNTSGTGVGSTVNNGGSLGATYNGTLMGNATIAVGMGLRGGNALAITTNASSDFMGILAGGLPLGSEWTASSWFNGIFPAGSWRTLYRSASGDSDHQVIVQAGGTALGMYNNGTAPCCFNQAGTYDVAAAGITSGWHQLTVVGFGIPTAASPGFENFYVDGVLVGTTVGGSNSNIYAVGNYQGGGQGWGPIIDETYIYQTALSPSQVLNLYNATAPVAPSAPGASSYIADSSAVIVAAGATFDTGGYSEAIGSLAGAGSVLLGAGTLTVGSDNTNTAFSGVISGTGGLTKVGSGTFQLNGANTYTGRTAINSGTLGGTGSLSDSVTFGFATLAPGIPTGTLTVGGSLTLGSNSTLAIQLGGTLDQVSVGGTVALGGAALNLTLPSAPATGSTFTIVSAAGGVSGQLSFNGGMLANGATFTDGGTLFQISYTPTSVVLTALAPPVPPVPPAPPAPPTPSLPPIPLFAVGSDEGVVAQVNVYNASTQQRLYTLFPFGPYFTGGVRVAVADVLGNGRQDIICAAGPGAEPAVSVYDGATGNLLENFIALGGPSVGSGGGTANFFAGGLYVAAADLFGQGYSDIIVGAGAGGGPEVNVFDGKSGALVASFYAFSPFFTGGVRVAAGDLFGTGKAEIICAAGPGGGPQVTVFDASGQHILASFFATVPTFGGGVYVAAGDLTGTGKADIICGAGAGGGPQVSVFNGRGVVLQSFYALQPTFQGGVRVGAAALNGLGHDSMLTMPGAVSLPLVEGFDGQTVALLAEFFAFDPLFTRGGYLS